MRSFFLTFIALPILTDAQTPLPYASGFDNGAQQAGWAQYRTGHLSNYDWVITSAGSVSAPNHLWHDYPVGGAATDTVQDWYVSPPFDFSAGASLTLKVNVYSITGSSLPSDALRIMLLTGSNDPDEAAVSLLADLTPLVTSSGDFTQIPAVTIPPTAGTSYIAFYYQATQNWFTPGIDDIAITAAPIGIGEHANDALTVSLRSGAPTCTLEVRGGGTEGALLRIQLFNANGALVEQRSFRQTVALGEQASGVRLYELTDARGSLIGRGRLAVLR